MSSEGIYFIYDPGDNGFVTFATAKERDAFAAKTIENCLDNDEWDSEVARICVGVITGRATYVRVEHRPPDTELDEDVEILLTPIAERAAREGGAMRTELIAVRCSCGVLIGHAAKETMAQSDAICGHCADWQSERRATEMRTLLADAAALLKDKLTADTGQLRTQWDRDVDEWLIAATPLFEEEER